MKSPSQQGVKNRPSKSSLRVPPSTTHAPDVDEDSANGRFSLAHELAVALMPEPTSSSKLLAEEFGIEYDEGAEGIDEERGQYAEIIHPSSTEQSTLPRSSPPHSPSSHEDATFDHSFVSAHKRIPAQDSLALLALDLEYTDKFLSHLRCLDVDAGPSTSQLGLERIASDVIRRLNDTARDREGQVRALLEYEREFRKIAGEVGGSDVLGALDELPHRDPPLQQGNMVRTPIRQLESVEEEDSSSSFAADWDVDAAPQSVGDEDEDTHSSCSVLASDPFPCPPLSGPPTAASSVPQLAHLRSFTTSLVASLSTISEQAQVNGAATTEAGRKIRALKNKFGGWRTDWDNAERSRVKIEKWEAGLLESDPADGALSSSVLPPTARRIDGRKVVEEHLQAFQRALTDAALKTREIMAQ
jgi:hypothetical protein